jgi:hypothetical protein
MRLGPRPILPPVDVRPAALVGVTEPVPGLLDAARECLLGEAFSQAGLDQRDVLHTTSIVRHAGHPTRDTRTRDRVIHPARQSDTHR